MNALVTGATGFLGSRLVRRLVAEGHHVAVLVRASSSLDRLADLPQIDVHVVDETPESLRRAVVAAQPHVTFHLATTYARDHRREDVAPMVAANITFPLLLVDALAREGARRFIDTGSAWQYFHSATYRPVCLHSATKEAFGALVRYFVDAGLLDCIALVMHDSYGPGDPRRKIFTVLCEHRGPEPLRMSGGEQLIDLIHVDDAVDGYLVAAARLLAPDRAPALERFSLSGGEPRALRAVVERYLRLADLDVPIEWGGRPYHEREVMLPWAAGERLPGWQPRIPLARGLAELAADHAAAAALP